MAIPTRGLELCVLKIPKGKFCIGKSLPGSTSIQDVNDGSFALLIILKLEEQK
jgi:hypothetical protein